MQSTLLVMHGQEAGIDLLEREAWAQVSWQPEYRHLVTTSGIGRVLGLTILLETGPVQRFARVGNYASYSRCVGSERLSIGKRKGRGNTKSGNKYLAWAYLDAANFALRYLPEQLLARFVVENVEQLVLGSLVAAYAGTGSKPYHPAMLVALLFYGYATGTFSSHKLSQATYDSIAVRYICANTNPDHRTIADFRKRFLGELQALFVEILLVAQAMGLVKLGTVSLDGTKIKANVSKHKALSWEHANRLEVQQQQWVRTLWT